MSDQFWLTKAQLKRIEPFFPRTRGIPRVDDRRVVSGISWSSRCLTLRLRLDCLSDNESAALRKLPQRSATSAYRRCLSSIDTRALVSLR